MSAWPKIRLTLLLSGIFVAGGLAGSLITFRVIKQKAQTGPAPERMGASIVRRWVEPLGLSEVQLERIRPLAEKASREMGEVRRDGAQRTGEILVQLEKAIIAELTDAQKVEFERLQKERRERWKRARQERGDRPPGERREGERREGERREGQPPVEGPVEPPPGPPPNP